MKRLFLLLLPIILAGPAPAAENGKPNLILLLADDLGWNGTGVYGSELHRTPNIDRLAAEGLRFTDAYAACTVCSPTRAATLTGMYPARLRVTDWITGQNRPHAKLRIPDWTMKLEARHTTLPEALKAKGYKTLQVGKWHLGGPENPPEQHGFERTVGTGGGSPAGGYILPNRLDLPGAKDGEYLTDRLTTNTLAIMEEWKDQPFFIYFAYFTVHTPIQGRKDYTKAYQERIKPDGIHRNAQYAAMHQSQDDSVGRILDQLEKLGIADNTVVLYSSDNGGLSHKMGKPTGITGNAPLRRGKGSAYEGGTRVPLVIKWPGVTRPGSVTGTVAHSIDFMPTFLDIAGATLPECDGASLVPILKGGALKRPSVFWHYPHYHAGGDAPGGIAQGPYGAVRWESYKLIEFYEDMRVELYDLEKDPGETKDLSTLLSLRVNELRSQLHHWRADVKAQMPIPNPEYDPERAGSQPRTKRKKK